MEVNKIQLKDWSKKTLDYYLGEVNRVGESVATSFYNQSDLSRVEECDLMIIGINPGCGCLFKDWGLKNNLTPDFLFKGNPCFEGKDDKEIIIELERDWNIWKKMHKMLQFSKKENVLEDVKRFVLTNMIFFGTEKQKQIPSKINKEECAKKTQQLIDMTHPKVIVLLGKECRNLFKAVSGTQMDILKFDNAVFYSYYNNSHVISIYHPSYYKYYTNKKMEEIGNIIGYALDNSLKKVTEEEWDSYLVDNIKNGAIDLNAKQIQEEKVKFVEKFNEKEIFQQFKAKIDPSGSDSCALFYRGKLLNYEYYTKINENKKFVNSKDTIAIDFLIEGNEYIIRVGTRRNDPEITRKIAIAIDGEFRPGNTDVTASHWHVHARKVLSTSNDEMVRIMNELLAKVKAYRDK